MHKESIFDIMKLTDVLLKFQSCGLINSISHHYWLSAKKRISKTYRNLAQKFKYS